MNGSGAERRELYPVDPSTGLRSGKPSRKAAQVSHNEEYPGASFWDDDDLQAESEYVMRQVYWEWKLHGSPFGGSAKESWNKLRDDYFDKLGELRGKSRGEYIQFLAAAHD